MSAARVAAKDGGGVGEAFHVRLERVDAVCEEQVVRVDSLVGDRGADAAPAAAGLAGPSSPQWLDMNAWMRSRARCRRLRNAAGVISHMSAASSLENSMTSPRM